MTTFKYYRQLLNTSFGEKIQENPQEVYGKNYKTLFEFWGHIDTISEENKEIIIKTNLNLNPDLLFRHISAYDILESLSENKKINADYSLAIKKSAFDDAIDRAQREIIEFNGEMKNFTKWVYDSESFSYVSLFNFHPTPKNNLVKV